MLIEQVWDWVPCILKSVFTEEYEAFLRRLIEARKSAGMTQQRMANRLNRPQSFVSKYERAERRLDVVEFVGICRVLDIDPCFIIREIEELSFAQLHAQQETTL